MHCVAGLGRVGLELVRGALSSPTSVCNDPPGMGVTPKVSQESPMRATQTAPVEKASVDSPPPVVETLSQMTLRYSIGTSMKSLHARDKEAFLLRHGYGAAPLKLEEIGARLGVTRERARQLVGRARAHLLEHQRWPHELHERVDVLLRERTEPLYLDIIAAEDEWFEGFAERMQFLAEITNSFCSPQAYTLNIDGRVVVSRIDGDRWNVLKRRVIHTLSLQTSARLTEADTRLVVHSIAAGEGVPELATALFASVEGHLHFARSRGSTQRYLQSVGRGAASAVSAILAEAGGPLTIDDIRVRLQERTGRLHNDVFVRSAISRVGGFPFPNRRYGLADHLPLTEEQKEDLLSTAEDILAETADGRQWHASEIAKEIANRCPKAEAVCDPYWVNILLHDSQEVADLGRMVWVAKNGLRAVTSDRRAIAELCVRALLAAGHPMSSAELRSVIQKTRGVRDNHQITPSGRLIRIGRGIWGLAGRDSKAEP